MSKKTLARLRNSRLCIKTLILSIALCLSFPSVGSASYAIHLKNGGKFVANHYWTEGTQLMFYVKEGIFGIERDFVRSIQKRSTHYRTRFVLRDTPDTTSAQHDEKQQETTSDTGKEVDKPFLKEFERLKAQYKWINTMSTTELYQFSDNVTKFKRNTQSMAHLYHRELTQVYAMADTTEGLINKQAE